MQTVVHHVNPPKVKVFPQQDFYSDENDCNLEKNSFPVASLFLGDFDTNKKNKNSFIGYLQFISNLLCTTFFSSCFVFIMTRGLEGEANIIFFQIPPNWIGIELLDK